jgi:cytoskeletal protein RodZ
VTIGKSQELRRRDRRQARPGRKKTLLRVLLAVILIVAGLVAWVGIRAFLARGELEGAIPLASSMQDQIAAGDVDGAQKTSKELERRAETAAALTSDPIWRAFESIPSAGTNLVVVRQLAAAVDSLARDGVAPLAQLAGGINVDSFRPDDGTIDMQPLIDARPTVARAAAAISAAESEAGQIDTKGTIAEVDHAVSRFRSAVKNAESSVSAVNNAVRLLPAMLGAEGPRDYAVLFQNPAELRSSGGIVGAVALVHTESGAMQLVQQAPGASFPRHSQPVLELPTETRGLYGDIVGQYMLNVGLTPDFSLTARLAQEMWRLEFGLQVDGVLSIDPIALGYLLVATGPIALPTGDVLTSDNAVPLLLTEVYQRYEDPKQQDAFFAAAAASVFSAVASGTADPVALIQALGKAGSEHRVMVWNSEESDQAILADTTLAGGLPVSDQEVQRFGLYFNDATGAKMDTYLDVATGVSQVTCRVDRRPNFTVEVILTNTAPADAATSLPAYVTGGGVYGIAPGNVKTIASIYGAPGLENLGLKQDGRVVPYLPSSDAGYPVSAATVELAPGQSTVLSYEWLGSGPFEGNIELQTTPVIHRNETIKLDAAC